MAIINISIVGSTIVAGSTIATLPEYNIVQLNGEAIVDKLRVVDYAMTTAELDALSLSDIYVWDANTLLYAQFTNNFNAGSIDNATTIDSWDIIRYTKGSITPTVIAKELDGAENSIVDYTAVKPNSYYYTIFPISDSAVLAKLQTNLITECYDYYAFIDDTTGESFTFKSNIEPQSITLNTPVITYEGFTQYPAKAQGQLKYSSGSFSALSGNVSNGLYEDDTVVTIEALKAFISNNHSKIMKDRKGNIRRVFTENLTSNGDEKPSEIPTTISFQWTEVGAV